MSETLDLDFSWAFSLLVLDITVFAIKSILKVLYSRKKNSCKDFMNKLIRTNEEYIVSLCIAVSKGTLS